MPKRSIYWRLHRVSRPVSNHLVALVQLIAQHCVCICWYRYTDKRTVIAIQTNRIILLFYLKRVIALTVFATVQLFKKVRIFCPMMRNRRYLIGCNREHAIKICIDNRVIERPVIDVSFSPSVYPVQNNGYARLSEKHITARLNKRKQSSVQTSRAKRIGR